MTIMTVTGSLPPDQLGVTSIHEHIFSDLSRDRPGAEPCSTTRTLRTAS